MSLLEQQRTLAEAIKQTARTEFDLELETVTTEIPPKIELGDLAFPVAFELAKLYKQKTGEKTNPRQIAEKLQNAIEKFDFVSRVEVAGAGYLNVFYNRAKFLADSANAEVLPRFNNHENAIKNCVEHTSVNPNKAAHIGHIRNSVLGDTFVRVLRANGERVEVQNYIDNTGVQVADVVVGFVYLESKDLPQILALDAALLEQNISFDYYCWDLYARVGQEYQKNEELKSKRAEVLHLIEAGNNPTADLADYVAMRNVQCILATMNRLGIRYDLLPRESEILHLHFWQTAFEKMKQLGVIHFADEGKNKGCWVMPFEAHSGDDEHEADKILVRSNNTVTYTGKDIAYQMWKLGLLDLDFFYNLFFTYDDDKQVWVTTSEKLDIAEPIPAFGNADRVFNVIDSRQSYPQEVVKKGVSLIAPERGEAASVHLSYEMVALSPAAAVELGFEISDEDKSKTFIEMSGRKGLGVKADDFISRLEEKALAEVEKRHPDIAKEEKSNIAHIIAVGALRYFLLKFTRSTVIVFDFDEALSFEGETGVFCQYSAVRANSIFRKLTENGEDFAEIQKQSEDTNSVNEIFTSEAGDQIWSLLVLANRLEETVANAANAHEPAILAKYAFGLAKQFNLFYHNHKIISEENKEKRRILIQIADVARQSLTAALATLGIDVPDRM